jgi:hypothetical protein
MSSSIELDISLDDLNRQFVHRIQESDVKYALKRIKGITAMGLDGIPIEIWRSLGDIVIVWLTELFNLIFLQDARWVEAEHFSINLQEQWDV